MTKPEYIIREVPKFSLERKDGGERWDLGEYGSREQVEGLIGQLKAIDAQLAKAGADKQLAGIT